MRVVWTLSICLVPMFLSAAPGALADNRPASGIDALVAHVCDRGIVVLGEDSAHGSGVTIAAKAAIVERLATQCGFGAIAFESQVYDFLALESGLRAGRLTQPGQVYNAIGGLWSTTAEIEPQVAFLHRNAAAGRMRLLGIDPQLGGATQTWSRENHAARLASALPEAERPRCLHGIDQLARWRYTSEKPYDAAARNVLRSCAASVERNARSSGSPAAAETAWMATNLAAFAGMSDGDAIAVRERMMFRNVDWHMRRLPRGTKLVVWCATIHAIKGAHRKTSVARLGTLLHRKYGRRVASIGFSAISGSTQPRATVEAGGS